MWWFIGGCILVLLAILALILRLVAFPPDWIDRYPNGQIQARGAHFRGDRQDHWRFWHEDGRKEWEGEYIQGIETGIWKFYHRNGQLAARGTLDGWDRKGTWEFWNDVGDSISEVEFLARYPACETNGIKGKGFPSRSNEKPV